MECILPRRATDVKEVIERRRIPYSAYLQSQPPFHSCFDWYQKYTKVKRTTNIHCIALDLTSGWVPDGASVGGCRLQWFKRCIFPIFQFLVVDHFKRQFTHFIDFIYFIRYDSILEYYAITRKTRKSALTNGFACIATSPLTGYNGTVLRVSLPDRVLHCCARHSLKRADVQCSG